MANALSIKEAVELVQYGLGSKLAEKGIEERHIRSHLANVAELDAKHYAKKDTYYNNIMMRSSSECGRKAGKKRNQYYDCKRIKRKSWPRKKGAAPKPRGFTERRPHNCAFLNNGDINRSERSCVRRADFSYKEAMDKVLDEIGSKNERTISPYDLRIAREKWTEIKGVSLEDVYTVLAELMKD